MIETWGVLLVSAAGLALWLAVAWHVRDDRAPYVWLIVLACVALTVAGLGTYAGVVPLELARFAAGLQRIVYVLAGVYALWRVTRR